MAKEYDNDWFYKSKAWVKTRNYYMESVNHICEKCGEPASIVHHIIWLDGYNVHDSNISLNEDNLMAVCLQCHNVIHYGSDPVREGLMFTADGQLIEIN